ncbi:MAG TPA: hypothetical protein VGO68_05280 [Pyrinomonadaceae bacterium]|nr:hypothetical protein [Pyrinomonadaceae bacterium]
MLKILKDELQVLVFNACYTKQNALTLSETFNYTIGMNDTLDEQSAIDFSASFYQALGFGRTVQEAFELAVNRLGLEGRISSKKPFFLSRKGLDTSLSLVSVVDERDVVQSAAAPGGPHGSQGPLFIPKRIWDPAFNPPAALLRADFRVVPFFGRVAELAAVDAWLKDLASIGVMLMTGRGGTGKTRLAVEISLIAKQQDYDAGFLSISPATLSNSQLFQSPTKPVLAVIDYAEEHREQLPALIQAMIAAAQRRVTSFRLLLLARSAGEWWNELTTTPGEVSELLQSKPATKRLRLDSIAANDEEARTAYQQAFAAFSNKLGSPSKVANSDPGIDPSREALLAHTQALLRVLGETQGYGEEFEVFEFLLNRERAFWKRQLVARGIDTAFLPTFEKLVAAVTLRRGAADIEYVDTLIARVRTTHGLDALTAINLRGVLTDTYGNAGGVEPLQPDPLGEHLLAHHMTREIEDLASF